MAEATSKLMDSNLEAGGAMDLEALLANETRAVNDLRGDVRSLKYNPSNPGPTGLFAFGFTTILSMFIILEIVDKDATTFLQVHAVFHGGLVQLLAGMWDLSRGKTFTGSVFTTYGAFWMIDLGVNFLSVMWPDIFPASKSGKSLWMAEWALITLLFLTCTIPGNRVVQVVFATLFVAFVFLSAGAYNDVCDKIGAAFGVVAGLAAVYMGWGELANEIYRREVLPLWARKTR